ncbi:AmmeMemoRadiSam system radical SAM enzyme [Faecalicatena orotica]|uniref:Pyruvate formate lyase activating enzyme n=1 Tax=Faecalicatena orotica TaxID=1544 RepID=A0A2Y9BIG1_9FIRM|nr:AmmeMemoRadiSam system radical SAM enzyme [Faecalicatena orotica]PWJ27735.1 pyruvate formate lyase activating enzyme [Faecalicatena orotica]SSA57265.1 pyruvate formate lyase activating enzyme [Faecalicatena orotica]
MKVICQVCMHHCQLEEGKSGICKARKNEGGSIVCSNYGQVTSLALDPIEKKPLRMFRPGTMILSAGSYGCNLRCPFCQNHEISMAGEIDSETLYLSPQDLADKAAEYRSIGNIGIAYTYNEPLVGYEYVRDTSRLVKEAGMVNVLVTNGSASLPVLEEILPYIDAMNIDLKGFSQEYYRKLGGDLETVKNFIERSAQTCHVELTTLIVPGENDSTREMEAEAGWIASLNAEIPLHVTRFFPQYHMKDRPATDVERVYELADTARKYLKHVFVGNC